MPLTRKSELAPDDDPTPNNAQRDELLRQSLKINPRLKDGNSTQEVVESLRKKAAGEVTAPAAPAAPVIKPVVTLAEIPIKDRIQYQVQLAQFLDRQIKTFTPQLKELAAREEALKTKKERMRDQFLETLGVALKNIPCALEIPEVRQLLTKYSAFLGKLGADELLIRRHMRE